VPDSLGEAKVTLGTRVALMTLGERERPAGLIEAETRENPPSQELSARRVATMKGASSIHRPPLPEREAILTHHPDRACDDPANSAFRRLACPLAPMAS
jgi:hypothetical protein